MKRWLIIATLGIWFLCGCQAARDYQLAASDPVTAQQIHASGDKAAEITSHLLKLIPIPECNSPVAIFIGTCASLITGIIIGRNKRKANNDKSST